MHRTIRPIRVEGNVAYVALTKGCEAIIDAEDAHLFYLWNWKAKVSTLATYGVRNCIENGTWKELSIHRIILSAPHHLCVDHKDGNGLNNIRSNLRLSTKTQNAYNQKLSINNSSGFKGVHWCKRAEKWKSGIRFSGRSISLGYYATPQLAYAAYCKASAKYHGEFGRTAFAPPTQEPAP